MSERDRKSYFKKYRLEHREVIREKNREYNKRLEVKKEKRKYYLEHPEMSRESGRKYRLTHPEEEREGHKKYQSEHTEERKKYEKEYRLTHPEKERERVKRWNLEHADEIRERVRKYNQIPEVKKRTKEYQRKLYERRWKEDTNFRIKHLLRTRLLKSFKQYSKTGKLASSKYYGIDMNILAKKLVATLPPDFSERKYHIHHQIPCYYFNWDNPEQVKKCVTPENVQWLIAEENDKRQNKILEEDLVRFKKLHLRVKPKIWNPSKNTLLLGGKKKLKSVI